MATNSKKASTDEGYLVAPKKEVLRFIKECLMKTQLSSENAEIVAHHLMSSDYRGKFGAGLIKLSYYVNDLQQKLIEPKAKPKVLNDFQAVALVDGGNGLGAVVGRYCMRMAIEKAYRYGVGFVSARGSNHFGSCDYYTLMAMDHGMIGLTCTNTSPLLVPTGSSVPALGTNPLCVGMSAGPDQFLLDMSSAAISYGNVELARSEGRKIPNNCALDKSGNTTTDPDKVAYLQPMGTQDSTGHKGYGLSLMVEILCGILSGSDYGPNIRKWGGSGKAANLGQCFLAVNPGVFAPGAKVRLTTLLNHLRELPHLPGKPVKVPGDLGKDAMKKADKDGGIAYPSSLVKSSIELAQKLGVEPMNLVKRKKSCCKKST